MDIAREICTDSFYTVNGGLPRVPLTAVKAILTVLKVSYTLQSKCKTCFGGPRMVLQAHLKNTLLHLGVG